MDDRFEQLCLGHLPQLGLKPACKGQEVKNGVGFILLPIILPIIGGIPMMLYFTKIKKAGMLLIFEILFGLVMILTGMGVDLLIGRIIGSSIKPIGINPTVQAIAMTITM